MPRATINLEERRGIITSWHEMCLTDDEIIERLRNLHQVQVSKKTLRRRLKEWNLERKIQTQDTPELRAKISYLFIVQGFSDTEILHVLKCEGFAVSAKGLSRVRKDLQLYRRLSQYERAQQEDQLRAIIQAELDNGEIEGYGRRLLHTYFRTSGVLAARDTIFAIAKELNPAGNYRRTQDLQRNRTTYSVPGPDAIWCCDGHDKLAEWGIEIYGGIDAYSRYVPWIYVVSTFGKHPDVIRTDRGKETTILSEVHFALARTSSQGTRLSECHFYGTSKKNQRIEQWWGQLEKSCLVRWRTYFQLLTGHGHFDRSNEADRIAFIALYMPIIRKEVFNFVEVWNRHAIRKQPKRPEVVTGKPIFNYWWPGMRNGEQVQQFGRPTNMGICAKLQEDFPDWDIDEYLPQKTLDWIKVQLSEHGINQPDVNGSALLDDGSRLHVHAYVQLRDIVRRHFNSHSEPILSESAKPEGGYHWIEQRGGYLATLIEENNEVINQYDEGDNRLEAELENE